MARASKQIAKYTPQAGMKTERCGLCMHFLPPDSCSRVVGEIKPEGWCKFFVRKGTERSAIRWADLFKERNKA